MERSRAQLDDQDLVFKDPAAFRAGLARQAQEEMAAHRLDMQREMAEVRYGDALDEARTAFGGLPAPVRQAMTQSLMGAPNPFVALMEWHRREKVQAAIPDGDLTRYEASLRERLLKDPDFRKQAIDAARAEAGGSAAPRAGERPGNVFRLPSASRAGTAAMAALPDEPSDQELLHEITARR